VEVVLPVTEFQPGRHEQSNQEPHLKSDGHPKPGVVTHR
jgi:hypothetical protein